MIELLDLTEHAPAQRPYRLRTALAWLGACMAVLVIGLALGALTATTGWPWYVVLPGLVAIVVLGFRCALYLAFH
jgi:hypothetical protein